MRITVSMREDAVLKFTELTFNTQIEEAKAKLRECGDAVYASVTSLVNVNTINHMFVTLLNAAHFTYHRGNTRYTEHVVFSVQKKVPRGGYFYTTDVENTDSFLAAIDAFKEQDELLDALKNRKNSLGRELNIFLRNTKTLKGIEEKAPDIAEIIKKSLSVVTPNLPCQTFDSIIEKYK